MKRTACIFVCLVSLAMARADTTIDATNAFSWGANIGFMNWQGDVTNGVVIGEFVCSGFIYGANVGWINMGNGNPVNHIQYSNSSADDFGVNFIVNSPSDTEAQLRGFAYGANIGWINFEDTGNPRVDLSTKQLHGFAYGANVGWINLGELGVTLQTDTIAMGVDTDGNGLADAWEFKYFGHIGVDPNADPDSDGLTNLQEYHLGTSPLFPDERLLNISTRMRVLTGDNVLIGGFIITGVAPKKVILRGIGPSLTSQGVPGALQDPVLELHASDGSLVASNDNWKDTQQTDIEATTIPPTNDLESAIVATLPVDAAAGFSGYTVILRGNNDATGIGLVEAYDLDQSVATKFANISTRGFVDTGDNAMIGGFIIGGSAPSAMPHVVVRAIGPSLANSGVQGSLQDPTLELHDGTGTVIAFNDNWKDSQQTEIETTGIPPTDDRESAIVTRLAPGNYTAIVRGNGNTTGVALVEVYNVP
jgi:hypothetical protein